MENSVSLNGDWRFDHLCDHPYTDAREPEISADSDSAVVVPVPGYWEDMAELFRATALHTKLQWNPLFTLQRYPQAGYVPYMALPNPVGCFAYQKTVCVPEDACLWEASLTVGGAQNAVSAWINGHYLGRMEGYSAPLSFPVPRGVLAAGENRVTLAVSNFRLAGYMGRPVSGLTSRAANECTGGIWGDVSLDFMPDGLRSAWVTTDADLAAFTVHTEGAKGVRKAVRIYLEAALVHTAVIPAGETKATISAEGFRFWSPGHPVCYRAEIETERQVVSVVFGIRRLSAGGTRLFLNGEPYYFRGTCEHCYQPMTVHPTRDRTYYRHVIRTLKGLGFNSIRFHTWVPPTEYMEAADELGMVLEIESPDNSTAAEWERIIRNCRPHPSVCVYSTGNELQIDDAHVERLRECARVVHALTDSLFSPMSALRGVEYYFVNDETTDTPFRHNPKRLSELRQFSDLFNSYSNALTSYSSSSGTQPVLDARNSVYGIPLLSHEICIHGTYCDLSLEARYAGTRIGDTEFMCSVRAHLAKQGLLERAPLYYRNSAAWQRLLRKHCFETVRRCDTFAGYDFLGDIDTHWHTFGYCVGMMNEFYELKPGETRENVLRYNSDTVLLADLPECVNIEAGAAVEIPILVSNYGEETDGALLQIRVNDGENVIYRLETRTGVIPRGAVTELYRAAFRAPDAQRPKALRLTAALSGGNTDCENAWELYVFPGSESISCREEPEARGVTVLEDCDGAALLRALNDGGKAALFGVGPFASQEVSFQISIAGRTTGHLATVIADHPLMEAFPHEGFCGNQFRQMLDGSRSVILDGLPLAHEPIIDIASSYKNAHREAMLFEYRVGRGKLLVCTLRLTDSDPAARWLKRRILEYAMSERFSPEQALTLEQFAMLCRFSPVSIDGQGNLAANPNDPAAAGSRGTT